MSVSLCHSRCGTVYLNSFSNRTSPSDNWKRLCLVSLATALCVCVKFDWSLSTKYTVQRYHVTWNK